MLVIFVLLSTATLQNWTFKQHCIVVVKNWKTYDLCNRGSENLKYFDIRQILPIIYVWVQFFLCLPGLLNSGLTSNKPTHYQLDFGNFIQRQILVKFMPRILKRTESILLRHVFQTMSTFQVVSGWGTTLSYQNNL